MAHSGDDMTVLAESRLEFEAQIMAESLRERGIAAHVASADFTTLYGMGRWNVLVRRADLGPAREALVEVRKESGVGAGTLAACPGCDYELRGLPEAAACPECGLELGPYRTGEQRRGIVGAGSTLPPGMARGAAPAFVAVLGVLVVGFALSQAGLGMSVIPIVGPVAVLLFVVAAVVAHRRKKAGARGRGGDDRE